MENIRGSRRVARVYGRWPTFSGGELSSLRLRQLDVRLDLTVHYWKGADSLARYDCPRPFAPEDDHRLIRLSFADVELVRLEGFSHKNIIAELRIIPGSPMRVLINPEARSGFQLEFKAAEAWVSRFVACDQYGAQVRG